MKEFNLFFENPVIRLYLITKTWIVYVARYYVILVTF